MLINRHIRSFVRREGRMTDRQKMAFEQGEEQYVLSPDVPLVAQEVFGNNNPLVLEIGFGMGHSLFELAKQNPNKNYIGIEVHRPGVGALLANLTAHEIKNVRIYCDDAMNILKQCIPSHSISELLIYFPDPWPKKRHHKRRLVQVEFIQKLLPLLKPKGIIHCATDWEDYAHHMMEVLSSIKALDNTAGEGKFAEPENVQLRRPQTKFEQRGLRLGHEIYDLIFSLNQIYSS